MSIATEIQKSVTDLNVLVEIDISELCLQWVNIGSGIWYTNAENIYTYVDSSLNADWVAQDFGVIGSMYSDSIQLLKVSSLLAMNTQAECFYYNNTDRNVYIRLVNYDNPLMHVLHLGVIYPVSYKGYHISGLTEGIKGRLESIPSISIQRDLLFYGRLRYSSGSIRLHNADGFYDMFGENNNLFGNEVRIKIGSSTDTYDDYLTVLTNNIETVDISEDYTNISLIDKRKYLSKRIRFFWLNFNGAAGVANILTDYLGYTYSSSLYDLVSWVKAINLSRDVTIRMDQLDAGESEEAITVIEWISLAVNGFLYMTPENKFAFKIIDTTEDPIENIPAHDIRNKIKITYNPNEVATSIRVGYAKNWTDDTYTYYLDDTRETTIFKRYKVYKQNEYDTVLPDQTAAEDFADTLLDYTEVTHGVSTLTLPLKYYTLNLGDMVNVQFKRNETDMLGIMKCEVIGKKYNFDSLSMDLTVRIIQQEDGFFYIYDFNGDENTDIYDFNSEADILDFNGGE